MTKGNKASKTLPAIEWHNETTQIDVHPHKDAPEAIAQVTRLEVQAGRTVPDGEKVKRAAWRVRCFSGSNAFPGDGVQTANAKGAITAAIKALYGTAQHHDVDAAVKQFSFPEIGEEDDKPAEVAWTERDDSAALVDLQNNANESARLFMSGESNMREGFFALSRDIAIVADKLSNSQFKAWRDSAPDELKKQLSGKNSKAEFLKVGRLPRDYFDLMPETSNSAKAYERNLNIDKAEIAENIARVAWKNTKSGQVVTPAKALKTLGEVLTDYAKGLAAQVENGETPLRVYVLAKHCHDNLSKALEDYSINPFSKDDEKIIVPAKMESGEYTAATQFGTGKRAHELIDAVCKAVAAEAPEAKAARETEKAERATAEAMRPKVFAEYSVNKAALHLAQILSSHPDYGDVFDVLADMVDRAEKAGENGWIEVLSDAGEKVSAEQAEAEKEADENSADDDA